MSRSLVLLFFVACFYNAVANDCTNLALSSSGENKCYDCDNGNCNCFTQFVNIKLGSDEKFHLHGLLCSQLVTC